MKSALVKLPLVILLLFSNAIAGESAGWVELSLRGTFLSLRVREATLLDILESFAAYGVEVQAQSLPDNRFNGSFENKRVDEALDLLLEGLNHDSVWRETPVGNGSVLTLTEIRVYRDSPMDNPLLPVPPGPRRVLTLPDGSRAVADEVLLGLGPGASPENFARVLRSIGGRIVGVDPDLGIYRVRLPAGTHLPDLLARLAREQTIAIAEPNFIFDLPRGNVIPGNQNAPGLLDLPPAPAGAPALAIIDSGLDPQWLGEGALRASMDVTGQSRPLSDPVGHGTQMALIGSGLLVPDGTATSNTRVPLVSIRGFDEDGMTTGFGLLESLRFAREQGASVVSMSWGSHTESDMLATAFARATGDGMVLLAAAGNEGENRLMFPAAYPGVIAVGAANPDGSPWERSNHGEGLDFFAPGHATFPVGHGGPPGAYAGTSIATPWVAAAITGYRAAHPEASPDQILRALRNALSPNPSNPEGPGLFDESARQRFINTAPGEE